MAQSWYVIEASEGGAGKAHLAFAVAGIEVWRPMDVTRVRGGEKRHKPRKDITVPRFGRYFFIRCQMTDCLLEATRRVTGVQEVLCACGTDQPAVVPDAQIEFLKAENDAPIPDNLPGVKDKVSVTAGPFEKMEGIVRAVDKRGVLKVEIDVFGRLTPVVLEASQVIIIKQAKPQVMLAPKKHRVPALAD